MTFLNIIYYLTLSYFAYSSLFCKLYILRIVIDINISVETKTYNSSRILFTVFVFVCFWFEIFFLFCSSRL